jgi:hypothetical protein
LLPPLAQRLVVAEELGQFDAARAVNFSVGILRRCENEATKQSSFLRLTGLRRSQ